MPIKNCRLSFAHLKVEAVIPSLNADDVASKASQQEDLELSEPVHLRCW